MSEEEKPVKRFKDWLMQFRLTEAHIGSKIPDISEIALDPLKVLNVYLVKNPEEKKWKSDLQCYLREVEEEKLHLDPNKWAKIKGA